MKAATLENHAESEPVEISIHAAREGGDDYENNLPVDNKISIHAAREGGDKRQHHLLLGELLFQSTPPVKAATDIWDECYCAHGISIHAAREGGDEEHDKPTAKAVISIHAAREGGDAPKHARRRKQPHFNPRRP